jgi:hypothetical protein
LFLFPKFIPPTEKSDYRPIPILPVLAKAFDNVISEQMVNYVGHNGLISSFQSGHSTATAIARVSDDIRLNMESNQPPIPVLLDFSKAFDSVCHGLFILMLRQRYGGRRHSSLFIFLLGIKKLHVGTMFLL